jgi:HEAT repeat protein
VRLAAVQALSHLKPWKLEQLVPRVIELLQHADSGVRYTCLEVLSELK